MRVFGADPVIVPALQIKFVCMGIGYEGPR